MRAVLGIGSNLGDRIGYLRRAVAGLGGSVAISSVYETEPIGGPPGQQDHLNIVVVLETDLSPFELLDRCHALEKEAGRERAVRWGPRSLDVDIIWHEAGPVDTADLVIPHPRARERKFVLTPLMEVAPDLVDELAPEDWNEILDGRVEMVGPLI